MSGNGKRLSRIEKKYAVIPRLFREFLDEDFRYHVSNITALTLWRGIAGKAWLRAFQLGQNSKP